MKKRECPSCAMEVDASAEDCPICGYEFPSQPKSWPWIAVVLLVAILLWMFW